MTFPSNSTSLDFHVEDNQNFIKEGDVWQRTGNTKSFAFNSETNKDEIKSGGMEFPAQNFIRVNAVINFHDVNPLLFKIFGARGNPLITDAVKPGQRYGQMNWGSGGKEVHDWLNLRQVTTGDGIVLHGTRTGGALLQGYNYNSRIDIMKVTDTATVIRSRFLYYSSSRDSQRVESIFYMHTTSIKNIFRVGYKNPGGFKMNSCSIALEWW
jgi:hypothetical protein